jgi:hypothetical protein
MSDWLKCSALLCSALGPTVITFSYSLLIFYYAFSLNIQNPHTEVVLDNDFKLTTRLLFPNKLCNVVFSTYTSNWGCPELKSRTRDQVYQLTLLSSFKFIQSVMTCAGKNTLKWAPITFTYDFLTLFTVIPPLRAKFRKNTQHISLR